MTRGRTARVKTLETNSWGRNIHKPQASDIMFQIKIIKFILQTYLIKAKEKMYNIERIKTVKKYIWALAILMKNIDCAHLKRNIYCMSSEKSNELLL